ncbi:filamentous hemagglutinin N-terminal domain-containing protein [Tolypothrix sp. PCC 7910]|uniref:two-partner secretion domain-containing protein n=1 Tax=Tolypothrix sp. PCC 7910 TaxID=2099387 RepID=UPI0014277567|nr:filamentous hemagglutinin N-terminal domain-containing protein [Tolypothrix sp. PCC 7910]QIR40051.1 filamentous hemagglutinin N-terminal domain-containing protein [Tolypothrix sp. PCC 7910]
MSNIKFALNNYLSPLFLSALCGWLLLDGLPTKAIAQITPNPNDANTVVNQTDNTFNIQGGTQTGTNLFHSFEKFGLNQGQTANFISNPSIQNILGRVTGGEASIINGLIQVTGGNSNLFLMNPAGIIFGANASLNVPAAFTATTASAIGFNNQWFNAIGQNDYTSLVGNPDAFAFTQPNVGAIINNSSEVLNDSGSSTGLGVFPGQNLTLVGGTVISTGAVSAPGGKINITAVEGEKLVRITPEGNLLSLGLPIETKTVINPLLFTPKSLPQLLTGGNLTVATGVNVEGGVVKLTASGTTISNGDVVVNSLYSKNATLSADNNFIFEGDNFRELTTSGDLNLFAKNQVLFQDFSKIAGDSQKRVVQAGGNLTIQGNQNIYLIFYTKPGSIIQTGGDINLISDGTIVGNARFATGRNFSILNLLGGAGKFLSGFTGSGDSNREGIISAQGDVSFGNYTGASLKIEAGGSITANGDIKIERANTSLVGSDPDIMILKNTSSLILRSGVSNLKNSLNPSSVALGGTTFQSTATPTSPASITINGNISILSPETPPASGFGLGTVILSAPGDINVNGSGYAIVNGNGTLISNLTNTGSVIVTSSQGQIKINGSIAAGSTMLSSAGNINIIKQLLDPSSPNISVSTTSFDPRNSDVLFLNSQTGNIVIDSIKVRYGNVDINTPGIFQIQSNFPNLFTNGGLRDIPVSIRAARNINIQHKGKTFTQGLGVERDEAGNPIYRLQSDNTQVFYKPTDTNSNIIFVDKDGKAVTGNVTVRTVPFNPGTVLPDTSYTNGLIVLQSGFNEQILGVYQDTQLGSSNRISVVTVVPNGGGGGGGDNGGGSGSDGGGGNGDNGDRLVERPDDAQRQLTRQPSQNDVCQPTNTSLTLAQKLKQASGISLNTSTSINTNACEYANQGTNLLQIIPDHRNQPVPRNLNFLPQSEINYNL